jgi:hypothetical protein
VEEQEKMLLAALNAQLNDLATCSLNQRSSHANFDSEEM